MGGGWFETKLFTQTIPQLSKDEPAVRYAAMAIGALARATSPNIVPKSGMPVTGDDTPHYKNALSLYGRALRLVRVQQGPNQSSALRAAVLSCLLFVCFEYLHGNREAALRHINHGLMMVEQFLRRMREGPHGQGVGQWKLPSPETYVEVQYTETSPAPLILEDEILHVFQRLDHQSWSTAVLRRARRPPPIWYRAAGNHTPDEIPDRFTDLNEARKWWDLVQHWVLHFSRTVADRLAAMVAALDPEMAETIDIPDVPGVEELQVQNLDILEKWNTAFWPIYSTTRTNRISDPDSYYRAVSLQIQYQSSWIGIRALNFSRYETIYAMTPHFRELLRLCTLLVPRQPKRTGCEEVFTIDNGPTMALFLVAAKCRDWQLRDEAIELLKKYPRRDGFWDSRAITAIAEVNKRLELENETESDMIEQWKRLRRREAVFDDHLPQCIATFYVRDTELGGWKLTNETVRW